ncbi:hypothetical protein E3_1260 [Rhodococcus phage E3]|uniref:hypothetical protein n=1 Tax=Rhodococcus phage E3 TaxID=1007869 RepID=UPI0002C6D9D3|nr:hypothetical protein M176_gp132 [Rhodococcus phage E3]AEQ21040.1 hypothetical protein E3_1260 [Rhodococcus phage E3]
MTIIIAKFHDAARNNVLTQIPLELDADLVPGTGSWNRATFAALESRGFQVTSLFNVEIAAKGPDFAPHFVNSAREQAIVAAVRLDRILTEGEPGTLLNPYINAQAAWFKEAVRRGVDEDQLSAAIAAELDRI